jgi:SAM-dependent methyltransferase
MLSAQQAMDDRVLEVAALEDGQRILDVGCGLGGTLLDIDGKHRGVDLVGLNRSQRQLEAASDEWGKGRRNPVRWVFGDACSLPFEAGSFDRVLAIECVFHFSSRASFLCEAARVLRPGGLVVLSDFVAVEGAVAPDEREHLAVEASHGPWPDLACARGRCSDLAEDGRWSLETAVDGTAQVLPNFAPLMEAGLDELDPSSQGTAVLGQLLQARRMRFELLALRREAGPWRNAGDRRAMRMG